MPTAIGNRPTGRMIRLMYWTVDTLLRTEGDDGCIGHDCVNQGRRSWGLVILTPLKIYRTGQSMFRPLKCHILSFKTIVG